MQFALAALVLSSCAVLSSAFPVSIAINFANLAFPSSPEEVALDVYEMVRQADVPFDLEAVMAGTFAELSAFKVLPALKQSARSGGDASYLRSEYRVGSRARVPGKSHGVVEVLGMQAAKFAIGVAGVPRAVLVGALLAVTSLGSADRRKRELLQRYLGDAKLDDVPREVLTGVLYVLLKEVLRVELDGSAEHLVDLAHLLLGGAATLGANLLTGRPAARGTTGGGLFFALYELFLRCERGALPEAFEQELVFDKVLDLLDAHVAPRSDY